MIIIRSRYYSDPNQNPNQQKQESHTGRNLAIGALGTAATIGGLWAGSKGHLGGGIQKGIGKTVGNIGKTVGSEGMLKWGQNTNASGRIRQMVKKNPNAVQQRFGLGPNATNKEINEAGAKYADDLRARAKITEQNAANAQEQLKNLNKDTTTVTQFDRLQALAKRGENNNLFGSIK